MVPPTSSSSQVIDLTGLESSSESGEDNGSDDHIVEEGYSDSEDSEIEITLNDETRAQLQQAIATVSEARLRALLSSLVEADIQVEAFVTRELVTLRRDAEDPVLLWDVCGQCDEEFETNTLREDTECVFHAGILEPSEHRTVDWDLEVHGPLDTVQNQKQYPEKFKWTCCEQDGNTPGCIQEKHKPRVAQKRKRC